MTSGLTTAGGEFYVRQWADVDTGYRTWIEVNWHHLDPGVTTLLFSEDSRHYIRGWTVV